MAEQFGNFVRIFISSLEYSEGCDCIFQYSKEFDRQQYKDIFEMLAIGSIMQNLYLGANRLYIDWK